MSGRAQGAGPGDSSHAELRELRRQLQLERQFIALASHELRSPATVIHGVALTVAARAGDLSPDQIARLHEVLVEHTDRLTRLIDELLDISRLEAHAIEIRRVALPVREHVERIVEAIAGERADEVHLTIGGDLRPQVDPVAFERILGNLLSNALRHGEAPINVTAVQNDRHFRLAIEDRGDGVSAAFVPRLFERFSRGGPVEGAKGFGLGLAIAQAYAQAHGGQLFYEDASPQGARFRLVLPSR